MTDPSSCCRQGLVCKQQLCTWSPKREDVCSALLDVTYLRAAQWGFRDNTAIMTSKYHLLQMVSEELIWTPPGIRNFNIFLGRKFCHMIFAVVAILDIFGNAPTSKMWCCSLSTDRTITITRLYSVLQLFKIDSLGPNWQQIKTVPVTGSGRTICLSTHLLPIQHQ